VGEASSDSHDKVPQNQQLYAYYDRVRSVTGDFELALGDGVHLKSAYDDDALPYVARVRGLCEERYLLLHVHDTVSRSASTA
jgi:hypothetical protein